MGRFLCTLEPVKVCCMLHLCQGHVRLLLWIKSWINKATNISLQSSQRFVENCYIFTTIATSCVLRMVQIPKNVYPFQCKTKMDVNVQKGHSFSNRSIQYEIRKQTFLLKLKWYLTLDCSLKETWDQIVEPWRLRFQFKDSKNALKTMAYPKGYHRKCSNLSLKSADFSTFKVRIDLNVNGWS